RGPARMIRRALPLLLLLLAGAVAAADDAPPPRVPKGLKGVGLDEAKVSAAVERGAQWLIASALNPDEAGTHLLAILALVHAGKVAADPALREASVLALDEFELGPSAAYDAG